MPAAMIHPGRDPSIIGSGLQNEVTMRALLFSILFSFAVLACAQDAARLERLRQDLNLLGVLPTPEEQAVAALPAEIRALVADLPPKAALRTVEAADQQLIALGTPYASAERRRDMVQRVRYGGAYVEASAGATSFPPLSPLVAPPAPQP